MSDIELAVVTGATGFVGAHIVDELLRRGLRVRAVARSEAKAEQMLRDRIQYRNQLEFVFIKDLSDSAGFSEAVKGADAIVHCASPVAFNVTDIEKELMLPAIEGTKAVLEAAKQEPRIKRFVYTSSFASVFKPDRPPTEPYMYTAADWNPITYDEAKHGTQRNGYRAGKKFAELALWDHVRGGHSHFDLVVICPPMVFGPIVHPVARVEDLNDSVMQLWKCTTGEPLPVAVAPIWVDVRDLSVAHAEALLRPEVSNKRFLVCSPEPFSYQRVRDIVREEFDWAQDLPKTGEEGRPPVGIPSGDGRPAVEAFGISYRDFRSTVIESITQFKKIQAAQSAN